MKKTSRFLLVAWMTVAIGLISSSFLPSAANNTMIYQVSSDIDDAEELNTDGTIDLASSDLEIVEEHPGQGDLQTVGIRFADVDVSKDSQIIEAYIQFACDEPDKNGNPFSANIYGEAADNARTYTVDPYNISSRQRTSASVNWSGIPDWTIEHAASEDQRTPNLAAIVQEIIDRPGWEPGNALAFIIDSVGTRTAESYDGEPDLAPALTVKFIGELQGPSNDKYRLVWNDDPATTMVIEWDQLRGTNPVVYYGPEDHGQDWESYPCSQSPTRAEMYRGMNNHFARLTGLSPDTAYYFVIKDSETVSERLWFRTAPNTPKAFTFISGGDTKSSGNALEAGRNSNRMVAKLRPLFVEFNGDFCSGDGTNDARWQEWLTDWSTLTRASDGRMFPLLPVHGNHENGDYEVLYHLFDAGNQDPNQSANYTYYGLSFGGNLLRVIALNSELDSAAGAFEIQTTWLETELQAAQSHTFITTGYHKPVRPHTSGKAENDYLMPWAHLFLDYGVRLSFDADSHMHKITFPIRSSDEPESFMGFIRDDEYGTMYVGEGSWGAWARPDDDDKPWTLTSEQIQQFKWICVFPAQPETPAHMDIWTVVTGTHGLQGELIDHVEGVGENTEDDVFAIPENITFVDIPFYGTVVSYPFEAVEGNPPAAPFAFNGEAISYTEIRLSWQYVDDPEWAAQSIHLERRTGADGEWIEIDNNIPPETTTYTQTDLHDGTDCCYRVRAHNIFGFSGYSNEALVTTPVDDRVKAEFQENVEGYAGTVDVEIREANPDTSYNTEVSVSVDNNTGNGDRQHVLIRFNDIFGELEWQIPEDATISQAILRVRTMNSTGNNISIHRMLTDWAPDTAWNMMDGGINADDKEASSTADHVLHVPQAGNYHTFDVTASLIAWQADASSNFGWGMLNDGSNGWDFYTSEWSVEEQRPLLTVFYTVAGDLDGDGDVDRDDISIIKAHRGESASACSECDIDEDGIITILDARKLVRMCTCPRCLCD